jgi:hypothetical protein
MSAKWANHVRPDRVPPAIYLAATVVSLGFVIAHLLRWSSHLMPRSKVCCWGWDFDFVNGL